ncbi:MAG: NAD(P)-dependent oxidoreductase [Sideroxyarcus sp.]|nr:NAD(P)-dependent oxidoreductase [Sideroxyarcus sp.]
MLGKQIGFIGVGKMGGLMSKRLTDAGYKIVAYDKDREALNEAVANGAAPANSAKAVGDACEIVFASLPTPDILNAVALGKEGVIEGAAVRIFVDVSTTGPRMAKIVAEAMDKKHIASVDAPVSGGLAGARDGKLAVMVSCRKDVYDTLVPILSIFGKLFFIGEKPGLAQTMKLANNLLAAAALAVSSEAMVMGVKAGIDPAIMLDVINAGSGRNSATQDKFPKAILTRTFDFGFATGLSYKDVRLCVDEAEAMGVPMVVGSAVRQMLAVTNALFGANSDFTSMVRTVEQWAGVEVGGNNKQQALK